LLNLGEVKTELRSRIGRGTALDDLLFSFIRKAIRSVEKKSSFNYMYHINEVRNNLSATNPRVFRFESKLFKSINYMLIKETNGEAISPYLNIAQVQTGAELGPPDDSLPPNKFLLAQENLILLNNTPQEEYTFEFGAYEYTSPQANDAYEHWLFNNFEEGLMDFAMAEAAKHTRDFQRAVTEKQMGMTELDDLVMAEEDKALGANDLVMRQDFYEDY
jgi:hypothetical protein